MSHFTPVKFQICSFSALMTALKVMGIEFTTGERLRLFNDFWEKQGLESGEFFVQLLVNRAQISNTCNSDLGFQFNAETQTYDMIADEWELRKWKSNPNSQGFQSFKQQLVTCYAIAQVQEQFGNDMTVTSQNTLEDGSFRLVLNSDSFNQQQQTVSIW